MEEDNKKLNTQDIAAVQDILANNFDDIKKCIRAAKVCKLFAITGVLALGGLAVTSILSTTGVPINDNVYEVIKYSGFVSLTGLFAASSSINNLEKKIKNILVNKLPEDVDSTDYGARKAKIESIISTSINLIDNNKTIDDYISCNDDIEKTNSDDMQK